MTALNKVSLVLITSLLSSCASTTKTKILTEMAVAGAIGAFIGQQKPENRTAYSMMYGGLAAAAAGAAGTIVHDSDREYSILKSENADLKRKLDEALSPAVERELPGTLSARVPEKYRALIEPGQWRVYELDQWVEDDENKLIHQDKMMELIPPSLRPLNKSTRNKGK